jgi:hypothetical protein
VYDILDCGPRRRFVVLGREGPFIVHNCENVIQATAYDVLIWQAAQILKHEGESLVLFTHDELAYIDAEGKAKHWEKLLTEWMRKAPPWIPDIKLDCEFGHGPTYADV